MTDKAQTILNKTAAFPPESIVKNISMRQGNFPSMVARVEKTGGDPRIQARMHRLSTKIIPGETTNQVQQKLLKMGGVVDRTVQELNDLQWGYRHMRNPYAEANSSSRNTNYMADYFAKQSSRVSSKQELQKKLKTDDPNILWHAHLNEVIQKRASLEKIAIIRKEKDGCHIYSHKGKHLGGPYSEGHAKKRLAEIEYFKKQGTYTEKERAGSAAIGAGSVVAATKFYDLYTHTHTKPLVTVGATALAAGLGAAMPFKFKKDK